MNPYECQRSRSFSDIGSRSLGLNDHQNFKHVLRNHRANLCQILYTTSMPNSNKVYTIVPGHVTKMATLPVYGKNPLKIFSRTVSQMTLKLGKKQKGLEPYKSYINDDPGLTLTYFTARSNLVPKAFE